MKQQQTWCKTHLLYVVYEVTALYVGKQENKTSSSLELSVARESIMQQLARLPLLKPVCSGDRIRGAAR